MGPFGFWELAFIFFIALIMFGPRKLPEIGKTLGKGLREFKKATNELKSNWEEQIRDVDSPVHEINRTINEVKSDVARATSLEDAPTLEEHAAPTVTEETKPDAHAN